MEAAEEAGSIEAMLLRIEGMETRDSVRNGHEGGDSGETGLDKSWLARGVGRASCSSSAVETVGESALDRGDFLTSGAFLSLPFPKTVFLSDPFLLRRF
jgi:hypothetical protein